jgi:hypothetical protein
MRKGQSLYSMVLGKLENEIGSLSPTINKSLLKMDSRFTPKPRNSKTTCHDIGLGNDFFLT